MLATQGPVRVEWPAWRDREALLPLRQETRLQIPVGVRDGVDPCQAHLLHQPVLQRFEQPFDAPFGLRGIRRNPLDGQLGQRPPKLGSGRLPSQLFFHPRRARRLKNAVPVGV